jgi:protein TonB
MHWPILDRGRAGAAGLTLLVVAGLGYTLVAGLAVSRPVKAADVMTLFSVPMPPPPPPSHRPPPAHPRRSASEGASAPPNLKSRATEVVAPRPIVPPIQPPPIVVAPIPSIRADASSGAALVAGPGTGAGGLGNGTGSGRAGNLAGAGGTPARVISRPLREGDLPSPVRRLLADNGRYDVEARYTVTPKGRVVDCRVTRSSGNAAVDAATCQAMESTLRYRPERDAAGRAIAVDTEGYQTWENRSGYAPGDGDD